MHVGWLTKIQCLVRITTPYPLFIRLTMSSRVHGFVADNSPTMHTATLPHFYLNVNPFHAPVTTRPKCGTLYAHQDRQWRDKHVGSLVISDT